MTDRETLEAKLETCVARSEMYQLIVNNRRPYALMAELLDLLDTTFDKEELFQPIREIGQKIYDQVGMQELKKSYFAWVINLGGIGSILLMKRLIAVWVLLVSNYGNGIVRGTIAQSAMTNMRALADRKPMRPKTLCSHISMMK
jgi:hypothetical protein